MPPPDAGWWLPSKIHAQPRAPADERFRGGELRIEPHIAQVKGGKKECEAAEDQSWDKGRQGRQETRESFTQMAAITTTSTVTKCPCEPKPDTHTGTGGHRPRRASAA